MLHDEVSSANKKAQGLLLLLASAVSGIALKLSFATLIAWYRAALKYRAKFIYTPIPHAPEKSSGGVYHYHAFRYHYIYIRKQLSHVTVITENLLRILEVTAFCWKNKETVTVMPINSENS